MEEKSLNSCLPNLGKELLQEIQEYGIRKQLPPNEYIVKQGQIIRFLPVIMSGTVKVSCEEEDSQFLLYYINSGETCIFSFAHLFNELPSQFSAMTELDSQLLLIPIKKAQEWFSKYPAFSRMILEQYQKHYGDLLYTTKQITCYKLEERLLIYLKNRAEITKSNILSISHQTIAEDLATSREVITRLMKKLELDDKVIQEGRNIKVIS